MPTYNYGDPSYDYPQVVIANRTDGAYEILVGDDAEMLPIVDAFCQGYAEAILWANAYHYVSEDDYLDIDGEYEMVPDDDAQYAYQSPGRWWEGMGIDFRDAVDFLAANLGTMAGLIRNTDTVPAPVVTDFWAQCGHDFALTRNGHGAGFWDRGYGDVGDRLTDAARAYGEHSVLTDDGPTVTTL